MHGAGGGAPKGNRNAWKHGLYSADHVAQMRVVRQLVRQMKNTQKAAAVG